MLSYWEKTALAEKVDLIIIGAGLTGLSAALRALEKDNKLKVRVIERGPFSFGASTRNAGFACFGSPSELLEDLEIDGESATLERVQDRYEGLQWYLEQLPASAFDFVKCGGWEIFNANDQALFDQLNNALPTLNNAVEKAIGRSVYSVDSAVQRFGMAVCKHAFVNSEEGQLHPGKLCLALEQLLRNKGVDFRFGVEAVHLNETESGVSIIDKNGLEWRATKCLVATNGLTRKILPEKDIQPARGQIVLTHPIDKLPVVGTFHLDRGYWYFRNVGQRLLLGGGRHLDVEGERTEERGSSPRIQEAIEHLLRNTLLPGIDFSIDQRWSGTMAFGSKNEKTPLIEALSPNIVLSARLGGMGVAMAPVVAKKAINLLD